MSSSSELTAACTRRRERSPGDPNCSSPRSACSPLTFAAGLVIDTALAGLSELRIRQPGVDVGGQAAQSSISSPEAVLRRFVVVLCFLKFEEAKR